MPFREEMAGEGDLMWPRLVTDGSAPCQAMFGDGLDDRYQSHSHSEVNFIPRGHLVQRSSPGGLMLNRPLITTVPHVNEIK